VHARQNVLSPSYTLTLGLVFKWTVEIYVYKGVVSQVSPFSVFNW
jgi:hypothetical protein